MHLDDIPGATRQLDGRRRTSLSRAERPAVGMKAPSQQQEYKRPG
ncbi:hypothetical protein Arad_9294 [Rhizobium rhizogenes K84]|uniref:Uncharacterized protein n=1 Tax=Rhizobium rhizogenes (strain K84 / ATCC BAA-868) TaxID=311403 RepID=B9JKC7_RHIR8|nr:hypothetical protein Arad_9294 [Rhizobium rhizogenes K84]